MSNPRCIVALVLLTGCNPAAIQLTPLKSTPGDTLVENLPTPTELWQRQERASPGSIGINEVYYHAPTDEGLEWIELHNPMALDMDLSGWALAGAVDYVFPDGTVLPADGFLVVAADPAQISGAMGPYTGSLPNGSGTLELWNNAGRRIDGLRYADDDPWPVQADGTGLTLAKIDADAASDHAENWRASNEMGGTPGRSNALNPMPTTQELLPLNATWTYDLSGAYPDGWTAPEYDDGNWPSGQAIFYAGEGTEDMEATLRVTADNYFGVYLGSADGSELRLVGPDSDANWATVEDFEITVSPEDHLFLAAWEASYDYGGPQMVIAEAQFATGTVGTEAATFQWVLGPDHGAPPRTDVPPAEAEIQTRIAEADAEGTWAFPAVEADRNSGPWGSAIGAAFDDATQYVWPDTFGDPSVTNLADTYALFRSEAPLLPPRGTTALPSIPVTSTFRTSFTLEADPATARLSLQASIDDGVILYLNGTEVLRQNMPGGVVDATTLASASADATAVYTTLPTGALLRGRNVLTAEVHQATINDPDLTFGCALRARILPATPGPTVVLNEIAPAGDAPFGVELRNRSTNAQDTEGMVLTSSAGGERILPAGILAPQGLMGVEDLGFPVAAGDVVALYTADRSVLLDAVRVQDQRRGRNDEGAWRFPQEASLGATNPIVVHEEVVINEIQYHHASLSVDGSPVTAVPEAWVELYNRGTEPVDLSAWRFVDAMGFAFPAGTVLAPDAYLVVANDAAAFQAEYPGIPVVGDFVGGLDNDHDRILLLDAAGNPADEVAYFDGGRWPSAADGGGSSLELRDPRADNAAPEAWADSDEISRSSWAEYHYQGQADPSAVGPDGTWNELVLGLLDAGEVLIDDLQVRDASGGNLVQNGSFDADTERWRLLGTHRHSEVIPDPDDASNLVLRLVATGPTEHMHNHAETTLLRPIGTQTYDVSFRARWVSGSNQLNSRLYFNRLPHTTLIQQPTQAGTPGAPNSRRVDNLGPTFGDLRQEVAVPAPGEPLRLSIPVADPDGVAAVRLVSRVDGDSFESQEMTESRPGIWEAQLAGQPAGTRMQVYVAAEDARGETSTFPADGPDSRALIQVDDGRAVSNGLHNFRLLMLEADSDWLLDETQVMSDDAVGGTVVYDEAQVFYDVGVRAKGSERGRPEVVRLGYGVSFPRQQLFRGSRSRALIDRSEGVVYGQREVLMNLVMTHAGSVSGEYNDLIQAITPRSEHTGPAELQLDRFSDLVLDAQFDQGSSGSLFKYELIYYPLTTDDGTAEGYKLPQPDNVVGTWLTDLGDDKEAYRWNFLIQNNEREDHYDPIIHLNQTFALPDAQFLAAAAGVIDVDEWLRAFAFGTLSGAIDNYASGSQHNAQFYVRPEDGRVLYFPHDLDFYGGATAPLVSNSDLARLLTNPAYQRAYYGHLQNIIQRAYNASYIAPWCDQLGSLLSGQEFDSHCQFMADRAEWVMNGAPDAVTVVYPSVAFRITTNGGADFSVQGTEVQLQGDGWVDVAGIAVNEVPATITWVDRESWQVTVPLAAGVNALGLVATNQQGEIVGRDSIAVMAE